MSFVIFLAGEVLIRRLSEVWAKCWLFVGRWTRKNLRVRRKAVNWRALWNSERGDLASWRFSAENRSSALCEIIAVDFRLLA